MRPTKPCKWCKEVNPLHWPYQCSKRPQSVRKPYPNTKPCSYCDGTNHPSRACFKRPRAPLRTVSLQTKTSLISMKHAWHNLNPPDEHNEWTCYLQISPMCPKKLSYGTLVYEHVIPKVKAPGRRFDPTNIKPSCQFCNYLKGSKTLEKLSLEYPHLKPLLNTIDNQVDESIV